MQLLNKVLDKVVEVCNIKNDITGENSITKEDIISKSKQQNHVKAWALLVAKLVKLGFSFNTIAAFIHRSIVSARRLNLLNIEFNQTSKVYNLTYNEINNYDAFNN